MKRCESCGGSGQSVISPSTTPMWSILWDAGTAKWVIRQTRPHAGGLVMANNIEFKTRTWTKGREILVQGELLVDGLKTLKNSVGNVEINRAVFRKLRVFNQNVGVRPLHKVAGRVPNA